jgi:hypothetical protein
MGSNLYIDLNDFYFAKRDYALQYGSYVYGPACKGFYFFGGEKGCGF